MRWIMYMVSYVFWSGIRFNAVAEGKLLCMFRKGPEYVVPRDFFMGLFDSGWL